MDMIGHDNKIVHTELSLGNVGAQCVNEQGGVSLGLQKRPPHARLRSNEKGTRRAEDRGWIGIADGSGHGQGLKPRIFN